MAHNISIKNGKAEMAYSGEQPWHGLGTRVEGLQTAQDMLRHAGLLWTVSTRPMMAMSMAGPLSIAVDDYRAIVRDDNDLVMGVASNRYVPIQNTQAGEVMDALVTEGGAHVEVAGALGQGERAWMLARIPGDFEVVKGDVVQPYALLAWGHDGKHGVAAKLTPVRVVCQNTLSMALGAKWSKTADVFIRHSGDVRIRIEYAQKAMGLLRKQTEVVQAQYRALASASLLDTPAYFRAVLPIPAVEAPVSGADADKLVRWEAAQRRILALFEEGKGTDIPGVRGTAWAAYNAVTEYVDHVYPVLQSGKVSAARQQSAVFGSTSDLKARALDLALAEVS